MAPQRSPRAKTKSAEEGGRLHSKHTAGVGAAVVKKEEEGDEGNIGYEKL